MKLFLATLSFLISTATLAETNYFARFKHNNVVSYGKVTGTKIQAIDNTPYANHKLKGDILDLKDVELLMPTQPQKVFAVGMNFASHIASPSDAPPPVFKTP